MVLGVSLSKEAASLALVEVAGGNVTVKNLWTFAYGEPELSLAQRAAFAAERTAGLVLPKTPVAICLPGDEVYLRPQTVPFSKRSHIARTLAFEMEDKLPFELDSAVMDFVVTGHEGGGRRILVAAMRRTVLEGVMAPFDSRGLLVRLVTADVLCAGALGRLLGVSDYGLLQVDVAGWKLAVCRDRLLLFARGAPAAPAAASMEESLAGWVRQSMMAAPSGVAPQVLYVTGYEANALDCQALGAALALEVEKAVIDHLPGEKRPDANETASPDGRSK